MKPPTDGRWMEVFNGKLEAWPHLACYISVENSPKRRIMRTSRCIIKTCIHSLEERAACLPLIVFKELIPGLKACRAPLQHRPTAPNMVKMAEGEDALTAMLCGILYCSTAHAWSVVFLSLSLPKEGSTNPYIHGTGLWFSLFLVQLLLPPSCFVMILQQSLYISLDFYIKN